MIAAALLIPVAVTLLVFAGGRAMWWLSGRPWLRDEGSL